MSVEATTSLDDAVYAELAQLAAARTEDRGAGDPSLRAAAESAVFHEARLLDDGRYRDWLDRFDHDAVYWVPIDPAADPRSELSFMLDDRRRLEDRVALLETGWAHAQTPPSRTCRAVSNVAAWPVDGAAARVRCTVTAWEYRKGRVHAFVSRNDYVLSALGDRWRIRFKVVALVDSAGDVPKFPFIL